MKNKKLSILGMLLCFVVLAEAQTKQPRIARAGKIKQEIANAENELTEALFKADKANGNGDKLVPSIEDGAKPRAKFACGFARYVRSARSLAKHNGWRRSNLVLSQRSNRTIATRLKSIRTTTARLWRLFCQHGGLRPATRRSLSSIRRHTSG